MLEMRGLRSTLVVVSSVVAAIAVLAVENARATDSVCTTVLGGAPVRGPGYAVAWRVEVETRTAVFQRLPTTSLRPSRWLAQTNGPSVLVLARPRVARGRCWVQVRLPWRPNYATGWVDAGKVFIEQTPWRIGISTARRTLTLYRAGAPIRTMSVVVGKPSTPTPVGLFAVTWAIPWHPNAFLGSWVLELTAHSDALQHYDGGDGTVGIHGRGGASLVDPLGSARSHGCIRLSNETIDWLVRTIRADRLPGTPVRIS